MLGMHAFDDKLRHLRNALSCKEQCGHTKIEKQPYCQAGQPVDPDMGHIADKDPLGIALVPGIGGLKPRQEFQPKRPQQKKLEEEPECQRGQAYRQIDLIREQGWRNGDDDQGHDEWEQ